MSAEPNLWVYQSSCYICKSPFLPQQKAYCRQCRRAVCPNCVPAEVTRKGKEAVCVLCARETQQAMSLLSRKLKYLESSSKWKLFRYPSEYKYDEQSPLNSFDLSIVPTRPGEEQSSMEEGFSRAREMLEGLKAVPGSQSSSMLDRFQVSNYDSELMEIRQQVDYYLEQLDVRDTRIAEMAEKITGLVHNNEALQDRVCTLEQVLQRLSDRGSDISSLSDKAEPCVKCAIF